MKRSVLLGRNGGALVVNTFVNASDGTTYAVFPGSEPVAVSADDVYPINDEEV